MSYTEKKVNEVTWDADEKVIGVLGLAPYATYDVYKKITELTPAKKDWEHIHIIIDSNPKIPSRGRALELGEESPVQQMREGILKLKGQGADFIIIPCNTAHYFYDEAVNGLDVCVLNIIEETSLYILEKHPGLKSVGLLASKITTNSGLYNRYFDSKGVNVVILQEDQPDVSSVIEMVKTGNLNEGSKDKILKLGRKLEKKGVEAVIVGCTELSLLLEDGDLSVPVYDSNYILAYSSIRKAKGGN